MKKAVFMLFFGIIGVSTMSAKNLKNEEPKEGQKKEVNSNEESSLTSKRCYMEGPNGTWVEVKCPKKGKPIFIITIGVDGES